MNTIIEEIIHTTIVSRVPSLINLLVKNNVFVKLLAIEKIKRQPFF